MSRETPQGTSWGMSWGTLRGTTTWSGNLIRKTKGKHFQNINKDKTAASKTFWNAVRSFITNEDAIVIKIIIVKVDDDEVVIVKGTNKNFLFKANDFVKNDNGLVEISNQHYKNVVEHLSWRTPDCLVNSLNRN